jgi:hypothetical protein
MISTVAFPIAFALLAALLLWIIIGSRGQWILKAMAIVLTLGTSLLFWHSLGDVEGWATTAPVPDDFEFHSYIVNEPSNSSPGSIFIWVTGGAAEEGLSLAAKRDGEPRAHIIPYSRESHERLEQATKAKKRGRRVRGRRVEGRDVREGLDLPESEFVFYDMPSPRIPEKDPQ